jgi:hypothetical protein
VEMLWPYTHDFIDCHIHSGAHEKNTLCFNPLAVEWKTGLQCLSVYSTVETFELTSGILWNFYARHANRRQNIFMFLFCTTLAPLLNEFPCMRIYIFCRLYVTKHC